MVIKMPNVGFLPIACDPKDFHCMQVTSNHRRERLAIFCVNGRVRVSASTWFNQRPMASKPSVD